MAQTGTAFYTGIFRHNLDDKGRLTFPSAWRAAHAETDTFMAIPLAGYIAVLPPSEVARVYAQTAATAKMGDPATQAALAKFYSQAQTFSFDSAGRVKLDGELLKTAGIDRATVIVGSLTKFHIYSPDRWAKEEARAAAEDSSEVLRRLGL